MVLNPGGTIALPFGVAFSVAVPPCRQRNNPLLLIVPADGFPTNTGAPATSSDAQIVPPP
ncbi:MAG: hypothetical protein IPG39_07165 [Bacteroidetes bacterium]|nr:hypothetical protein [Bacteroidota bacterium]